MDFSLIDNKYSFRILSTFVLIGLCSLPCFTQIELYNPDQLLISQEQKQDFNILCATLENIHPAYEVFTTKEEWDSLIEKTLNKLNVKRTELEFQNEIRRFLKNIGCGHTSARPSAEWYAMRKKESKILPINIFILKERLFIKYSTVADSLLKHSTEILSIDDVPAKEMIEKMREIQQVDGYGTTYETKRVEKLFQTYHLFLYGIKDEYKIEFVNEKGTAEEITVSGDQKNDRLIKLNASDKSEISSTGAELYLIEELGKTALLDINVFQNRKFKSYYKKVFDRIEEKEIENLIIDLRGNGGGYFPNATNLLRYLMPKEYALDFSRPNNKVEKHKYLSLTFIDKMTKSLFNLIPDRNKEDPARNYAMKFKPKKKNHYGGKIYLLTDGATFSMSSYVATKLDHHTDCTIIGQETGGGENGSYALLWYKLKLPQSQIVVSIPYYFLDHDVEPQTKGRGVMPDYPIEYDFDEIRLRVDKEMIMAENLIRGMN